ncbi:MAG: hypothetical protein V4501_11300 [Pseudomonadota bacterium]
MSMNDVECYLCGDKITWDNFSVSGLIEPSINAVGMACLKCLPNFKMRPYLCRAWATEDELEKAINDSGVLRWATHDDYKKLR